MLIDSRGHGYVTKYPYPEIGRPLRSNEVYCPIALVNRKASLISIIFPGPPVMRCADITIERFVEICMHELRSEEGYDVNRQITEVKIVQEDSSGTYSRLTKS